jgi:hypothetical protein
MGGVVPNRPQGYDPADEDDWLMNAVQAYWIGPCSDTLPVVAHGVCIVLPALLICLSLVGVVALLKWREQRALAATTKKKD